MAGYAIVPNIEAPELTGSDIAVWAALCRHAQWEMKNGKPIKSKAGTCFPSKEEIVKTSRYSVRTVYNSLAHLEALGYISRSPRRRSGNFISTGYQLFSEGERLKHNTPSAIFADGNICHRQYLPTGPAIFADDHRQYLPTNNIKTNNIIEQDNITLLDNGLSNTLSREVVYNPPANKPRSAFEAQKQLPELTDDEVSALEVLTSEMYVLCPDYNPYYPNERQLVHELHMDYPNVPLTAEFHKARDYLKAHPEKNYKDLLSYLRRWVERSVKDYLDDEEPMFIPAPS